MKVAVVGPGALGCLIAASLRFGTEAEVWLIDRHAERAALLESKGLSLENDSGVDRCSIKATADPALAGASDLILLCVKAGDIDAALERLSPLASGAGLIISLQNGIGHLDRLLHSPLPAAVVLGVTMLGANLRETGHVIHAGRGMTLLGFPDRRQTDGGLRAAAGLLNKAGLETRTVDNILEHIWAKLLINAGINALTAIQGCPNGELLARNTLRERMRQAVREAAAVAHAKGIPLPADPVSACENVCRATAANVSSMLQDVRNRRPTEIDAINGALVREARNLDLSVPVNEGLVAEIKSIERQYGKT